MSNVRNVKVLGQICSGVEIVIKYGAISVRDQAQAAYIQSIRLQTNVLTMVRLTKFIMLIIAAAEKNSMSY